MEAWVIEDMPVTRATEFTLARGPPLRRLRRGRQASINPVLEISCNKHSAPTDLDTQRKWHQARDQAPVRPQPGWRLDPSRVPPGTLKVGDEIGWSSFRGGGDVRNFSGWRSPRLSSRKGKHLALTMLRSERNRIIRRGAVNLAKTAARVRPTRMR